MKRSFETFVVLTAVGIFCQSGIAQQRRSTPVSSKRMTPTQRSAARLKNTPPRTWIRHYLGDDRYKIAGGVWKFVTTPNDRYYYRPGHPIMLSRSPNNVLGFASESDAQEAGYAPHYSVSDQGYGYSGGYSQPFADPTVVGYLGSLDREWYGDEGQKKFRSGESRGNVSRNTEEKITGRITLSDGVSKLATRHTTETTTSVRTREGTSTSTSTQDTPLLRSVFWKNNVGAYRLVVDIFQPFTASSYKGQWDPDFPGVPGPAVWDDSDYAVIGFLDLPRNYDITGLLNPRTFKAAYARLVGRSEMRTLLRNVYGAFPSADAAGGLEVRRTVIGGWPGVRLMPSKESAGNGGAGASPVSGGVPGGAPEAGPPTGGAPGGDGGAVSGGGGGGGQAGGGHGTQGDTGIPLGANIWIVGNPDANPPKLVLISAKDTGARLLNSLNLQPTRGLRPHTRESVVKEVGAD